MRRPITEQNSFVSRTTLLLVAAILLVPSLAAATTHPLFNLDSTTQSPFPSNRFTAFDHHQITGLRVNLPLPNCTTNPSDCADIALLNQLDGFNPQPRLSIPFDGAIDPSTANSHTVFLVKLGGEGREGEHDGEREHEFEHHHHAVEVVGINQIVWDPATLTLFAESNDHLDEDSTYLLVVTTGVHDASGHPIAPATAFQRLRGDDDDFRRHGDNVLSAYSDALEDALNEETLEHVGLSRRNIAVASVFTTESISATLRSIRRQIERAAPPVVDFMLGSGGEKTVFPLSSLTGLSFQPQVTVVGPKPNVPLSLGALQVFPGAIGTVAFGKFTAQHWQNAGVFIPAVPTRTRVPSQGTEELFFNLFIPSGPRPSNGWPVAIFGHGFTDSKQGAPLAVASTLAHNGIATIAINVVGHGFGPNGTLTVNQGVTTVVLPAGGRGIDQDGNGAITSSEGSSTFVLSPQALIGSRDALQQTAADLMQLVRAIQGGVDATGDGLQDLDPNRIYYFGQAFGGIYGGLFMGAEPGVRAGVLNVPGGSIIDIVREGGFRPLLVQSLSLRVPSLLNAAPPAFFNDNYPLRDLPTVINAVPGALAIQTVEDDSRWLGQAGDPVAWAPFIRKSPLRGERAKSIIVQFARGDQTVPNPTATALIRSGDFEDRATFFRNDLAFAAGVGFGKNPHTFMTNIGGTPQVAAAAIGAQSQIAIFFATDGALTIDPDGPGALFEVPITGPLPEDLGFIP